MCRTATEPSAEAPPLPTATTRKPQDSNSGKLNRQKQLIWIGTAMALLLILSIIAPFVVGLGNVTNSHTNSDINIESQEFDKPTDDNSSVKIVSRSKWGGALPLSTTPAKLPIKYVIISHTAGRFCETFENCSMVVRLIQKYHTNRGENPDIKYNFLVGGDGNIYEGRGWRVKNSLMDDSVNIAFIGNYVYDNLTSTMVAKTRQLVEMGVRHGQLDANYELVAHNQTMNTSSPGRNAYRVIQKWPHFSRAFISLT